MERRLLSGNEAIARGAYEGGVTAGFGYPGTPSSEILENLSQYPVYTEWSVNEKVALEAGIGASLAGARVIVTMKHVGLNVAADPLFTAVYTGVKGGLVIISADDPNMYSSQNEQDNRNYAYSAKVPMLEPSDSQEAKDFVKIGFKISEEFDTPVLLRTTTRISHSKTVVNIQEPEKLNREIKFQRNFQKYVMIPAFARKRHQEVLKRLKKLTEFSNKIDLNYYEINNTEFGIITSGVCYNYVKEVLPDASIFKLGLSFPFPDKKIREFTEKVKEIYVVEELDPYIENNLKRIGIKCKGKELFPEYGEITPSMIAKVFKKETRTGIRIDFTPPARPPMLCPGCPHRATFVVLRKLKLIAIGDIGCYTLGVLPPFNALDSCIDMGASITVAQGIETAEGDNFENNLVAIIGDSTFFHSGMTGLLNASYNKHKIPVIVLDNSTTAMTGMQPHPGTGETLKGESTTKVDYKKLAESFGINFYREVDAFNISEIEKAIKEALSSKETALIVVKGLCAILAHKRNLIRRDVITTVDNEKCIKCNICLSAGCVAISKENDRIVINPELCVNCKVCVQMCPAGAIYEKSK